MLRRIRFWWDALVEINELTRDREREDQFTSKNALHPVIIPGSLSLLFRSKPRVPRE
jgi:hypothetical protein